MSTFEETFFEFFFTTNISIYFVYGKVKMYKKRRQHSQKHDTEYIKNELRGEHPNMYL